MHVLHGSHRCSAQQQRHEPPFESLRESPHEGQDEDDAGGGDIEKAEDYVENEKAETDRVAKGLMDNTALEPSPPPAAAMAKSGAERVAIDDEDLREDTNGELGKDKLLDGDSTLGGMISPRPTEQCDTDAQNTNEAAS